MKTTRGIRMTVAIAFALLILLGSSSAVGGQRSSRGASMATVEGTVTTVETIPGESGSRLTLVRLTVDGPEPRELGVVLAPESTLRQIDFEVEAGDRLKARVFLSDDVSVLAHKVMNVTRGTMVRLRSFSRVPLWDGNDRWQGGPCRTGRAGAGQRGPRR